MKTVIVYASVHHGNTKKLVEKIAEKCKVDLIDAVQCRLPAETDICAIFGGHLKT